jgi:hypothetical protein
MTNDPTDGVTLSYDQENRITGAAGYTYTYDADGNRVKKSNGTTGTLYWYMTPGIVAESDLSGTLKAEYVFFDGERVARKGFPSNAVSYYFSDHLKTASVITDSAGNIKSESDFYPRGGMWGCSINLPIRFLIRGLYRRALFNNNGRSLNHSGVLSFSGLHLPHSLRDTRARLDRRNRIANCCLWCRRWILLGHNHLDHVDLDV